jgi:type I restriction enzyme R subunit
VERKFEKWLEQQEKTGTVFTPEQKEWLVMIKDYIATSAIFETDAFELNPFVERGGSYRAMSVFGDRLPGIIDELNEVLAA